MISTLITAAIILGAIAIFVILFIMAHKKTHRKLLERQKVVFADCVWKSKLAISEKETINNHLLAIDQTNFILLYINFNEPKEVIYLIDLWNVKSVSLANGDNSMPEHGKDKSAFYDKQAGSVNLAVTLTENSQPDLRLYLYQYKDGIQDLVFIKGRAQYWLALINSCIRELSHPERKNKEVKNIYS
jgi:hypothetical protein